MRDRRIRLWPFAVLIAIGTALGLPRGLNAGSTVTEADRGFWSFRKPASAPVPKVKGTAAVRTPVDAFLAAKLEPKGRSLAPEADPRVLVCRVSLDLIGLPPTPDRLALGRPPSASERAACAEFLDRQARIYPGADAPKKALADLCHTLLGTSEFLYMQ